MPCPQPETLDRMLHDDLPADEQSSVEDHVSRCDSCSSMIDELRSQQALLTDVRSAWIENAQINEDAPVPTAPGYDISRVLHHGGQGVVYEARQISTDRRVALKLLLHGRYASRRQQRRFQQEIELSAPLDHPNIATVFDSGATDDGQLFFVTRYVDGVPLDEYIRQTSPTIQQALELFTTIVHAVHYAHQRGVIHRDLKPNNILVTPDGAPHLLDFGLAKPIDLIGADQNSMRTQAGEFLGTLAYAAPEQVGGDPHAVDVRSDVYALGVIFFEMLTGTHPYPITGRLTDIVQSIIEHEPARVSSLRQDVDDELATVIATLLAKDQSRRYQSTTDLLRDLEHYRTGRPIDAKGASTFYILRKTLKRHRIPALAAVIVMIALIAATAVSFSFWRSTEQALEQSEVQASRAGALNDFLIGMLTSIDPANQQKDITVREALDQAALTIDESFADQPRTEATIRSAIGTTYYKLGFVDRAEPHIERALKLFIDEVGEEHPSSLICMSGLGLVYTDQSRFDEAEPLLLRCVELSRAVLGENDERTLSALNNLGLLFRKQGRVADALTVFEETLRKQRINLGDAHPDTLKSMINLGWMRVTVGRTDEGRALIVEAMETSTSELGSRHPETLRAACNLGAMHNKLGLYAEAKKIFTITLADQRDVLGEDHPNTLSTLRFLAWSCSQNSDFEKAEQLNLEHLAACRRLYGDEHPDTIGSMNDLSIIYDRTQRLDLALPLQEEALRCRRRSLGDEHPSTVESMSNLAILYTQLEKTELAEQLFEETYAIRLRTLGPDHSQTISARFNYAWFISNLDRFDEAAEIVNEVLQRRLATLGHTHPATTNTRHFLADMLLKLERFDEAVRVLEEGYTQNLTQTEQKTDRAYKFAKRISALFDTLGDAELAAEWRARAESAKPPVEP